MRKIFAVALAAVMVMGGFPVKAAGQSGAVSGVAQGSDRSPLRNYTVQVRNANNGQLGGITTSNQTGHFAFSSLSPGSHVVEILDSTGKVVGLSPSFSVAAGSTVTVTVSAEAAGAMAAAPKGGFSLFGLGQIASVGVAGAASAAAVAAVIATRDGKIVVCHVQGTARQTLEVRESAREEHLRHGDTLGPCPASPSR